jgi:hypothetical protein
MVEYLISADSLKVLPYCSPISKFENMVSLILIAALAWTSLAQQAVSGVWVQCGGIGWTGPITCAPGLICTELNAYYSMNHSSLSYVEKNLSEN